MLFGGLDNEKKNGKIAPNNDVFTLKLLPNNQCEWRLQACTGNIPLPRVHHAACYIGAERMLIFGGYYNSNEKFNDIYYLKAS